MPAVAAAAPQLEHLCVTLRNSPDEQLTALRSLTSLRSLCLRIQPETKPGTIQALVGSLQRLTRLECSPGGQAGLLSICRLAGLQALVVRDYFGISQLDLLGLTALKQLTRLDLCHGEQALSGEQARWAWLRGWQA